MKNFSLLHICLCLCLTGACPARGQTAKVGQAPVITETEADVRALTADYNSGRYLVALQRSRLILGRDPGNLTVHYLLGNIFIHLGRLDNAADEYDYCYQHGAGTRVGEYAQKALDAMNAAAALAAGQPPAPGAPAAPGTAGATGKIDVQTAEIKAAVQEKGAAFLEARRRTLEGQIKHLNEQAEDEISAVPKYIYIKNHRVANPDYPGIVQGIRDSYAAQIQVLQADNDNEEQKIGSFYKGLAASYDHSKVNLNSQVDDGRPGHKLVDPDPSIYVQNFASGHAQRQTRGTGVQLKTRAQELSPTQGPASPGH